MNGGVRRRAAFFLLAYTAAVLYLSLYPFEFSRRPVHLGWPPLYPPYLRRMALDVALNVALYVPMGAAATAALGRVRLRMLLGALFPSALSVGIEFTQRYIPTRTASYSDLISNGCGAAFGAYVAWMWHGQAGGALRKWFERCFSASGAVLVGLWVLSQGFLFLPVNKHTPLAGLDPGSSGFWIDSITVFLAFLALSLALRPRTWTPIVLAALPAAILFPYPFVLTARLAAAGLAIVVSRAATRLHFLQFVFMGWLTFYELFPFHWGAFHPFLWLPFEPLFVLPADLYYPVLFSKFFFYTATVWIMRYRGARWLWAAGIPALILAAGECAQVHLPGRTPESTDIVLLAAGALFLWLVEAEPANSA